MRILLAIGCNKYDHESPLEVAESDAERVFKALLRPEIGDYDAAHSELLLSPTLDEIRGALKRVLFDASPIDTFTFFFAGHGAVESGSFYMLPKDSPSRGLSMGALSLADLFRAIGEAAPQQSNIFIDACEANGLIADLGVLLKSDLIGDADTPGVTLVATAAQDQSAEETDDGGLGATALLDVIEGRDVINDTAPAFDLVEIGRRVSTRLRAESNQTPVVWGFNLHGPPRFCRNIRAGDDPSRPLRDVLQVWPDEPQEGAQARFEDLWRVYSTISDDWRPRRFARVVDAILASLAATPGAQAAVVERLAAACFERARLSPDVFRPAQVGSALLVCLLPYSSIDQIARQAEALCEQIGDAVLAAGAALVSALDADRYALLSKRHSGVADLFLLPLRIANVLGWTGAATGLFPPGDPREGEAMALFAKLLDRVIEHYSTSVVAVGDGQAAPFAVALAQAAHLGLTEQADALAGLLFVDLIKHRAHVARDDILPEAIFDFLQGRASGDYTTVQEWVSRPDAMTGVVLLAGARLGLHEVFDPDLWRLDEHIFTTYVPEDYGRFGDQLITGGRNLNWTIGGSFFDIAELDGLASPRLTSPSNPLTMAAAVLAALTYPDRVPWFLLAAPSAGPPPSP